MPSTNSTAHTAGPWIPNLGTMFIRLPDGRPVASVYGDHPECLSDECGRVRTILIAEAGTVAHETGLTPRQLAEQRAELLTACEAAEEWLSGWASAEPYLTTIRAAIAAAKGGAS